LEAALQPSVTIDNALPPWLVLIFFALNIVTVSLLAFVVLHSFVSDRRRLRELEVAYLNREMLLRQSQRLASLGTLAAGIVHELNNPAAATRRAAEQLRDAFVSLEKARIQFDTMALTPAGREMLQTCVHGVFAAGDVRAGSSKRVAAAVGEGSATIGMVHRYLETV
jgi:signal transduction histidine kinase